VDLAAAIFTENRKFNHYVASYGEAFRPHIRPFVLEATGAYGPIASAILKKIVELADKHQRPNPELLKARNHFLREVSVIMATSSAHMICFARTQMRQDGPGGVEVLPQEDRDGMTPDEDQIQPEARAEDVDGQPERNRALVGKEISQEVDEFMDNMRLGRASQGRARDRVRTHRRFIDSDEELD
jgi:hypothetical protein